jgi:hypothetical protein
MGGGSDPGPVYKASWYADENFGKEKGLNWGVRENTLLTALARSIVDNLSAEKVGKLKLPRPKAA